MRTAAPFAIVLLLSLMACAPDLPPLAGETSRVRYHTNDPDFSAEFLEDLDARLAWMSEWTGVDPGTIDYYHIDDIEVLQDVCEWPEAPGLAGCAFDGAAYSGLIRHDHELMHLFGFALGSPPRFMAEGLAERINGYHQYFEDPELDFPPLSSLLSASFFQSGPSRTWYYGEASSFVRFLESEYGKPFLLRAYAEMPALRIGAIAWLERATGMDIDALDAEWRRWMAAIAGRGVPDLGYMCRETQPSLELGDSIVQTIAPGENPPSIADSLDHGLARRRWTLDRPIFARWDGQDRVEQVTVIFDLCGESDAPRPSRFAPSLVVPRNQPVLSYQSAGEYAVAVGRNLSEPGELSLRLTETVPWAAPQCEALTGSPLAVAEPTTMVMHQGDLGELVTCDAEVCTGWLAFAANGDVELAWYVVIDDGNVIGLLSSLERCDECGSCTPVLADPTDWKVTLPRGEGTFLLRFRSRRDLFLEQPVKFWVTPQ